MSENEKTDNPFAPTPLGKGWTPPTEKPDAETGLADLFEPGDASSAGPADAVSGGDGGGLADLFEPETTAEERPSRAPRPRVRRRGVPAALRTNRKIVDDGDDTAVYDADERNDEQTAPPPREPRTSPAQRTASAPAGGSRGAAGTDQSPEAPLHAAADALNDAGKSALDSAGATQPAKATSDLQAGHGDGLFERGDDYLERVWNAVDQTIALVQNDIHLQRDTTGIPLTPDAGVFRKACGDVHTALRRKMASVGIAPSGLGNVETVLDLVIDEISGISVLGELFRDPTVDEILVDRWDIVSVERDGRLERTPVRFRSPQHAEGCARALALKVSDRAVSRAIPLVTAELPSARVTFAFGAVVKGGLSITIRKFRPLLGLDDLLRYGSLTEEMAAFLRDAVQVRAGILVSGGTGTGKTTIINLLSSFIPDSERVISIEDAFELKLANTHVVSLQTKEASSLDDTISIGLAELLRNTLRMRPDRIIVGEIREGAGAMVMLAAASTGHDGTLTTVHANSAEGAVNERLPDLVRQSRGGLETDTILRSIVNAFDLVIHVGRGRDGSRYIAQIAALESVDETNGRIRLAPVFTGTETPAGIRFERHQVGSETGIGHRLAKRRKP